MDQGMETAQGKDDVATRGRLNALVGELSYRAGFKHAEEQKHRIALVWPKVMEMPEIDRALIAGLSETCRLHERPVEVSDVLPCLRSAIDAERPILPAGYDRDAARRRFAEIIALSRQHLPSQST
ncbi:MAG: hypothetical protein V9E94_01215 [Microthrixaceae bacterium]